MIDLLDPFDANSHNSSYFTLSQFDRKWCVWIGAYASSRCPFRWPMAVVSRSNPGMAFFQKVGMHEAAARHNIPTPFIPLPCLYFPPSSLSLLCLPQNTPPPTLPLHFLALQPEHFPPFRKFGLGRLGSSFLPTAAWLGRTSTTSRHLKVIRAPITKSKPVAIPFEYLAEVAMRLGQIGDQVFSLAVTDLIQDLYPHLRVGYASVRQCVVIRVGPCLSS
jgi:hypothetical protein